MAKRLTTDEAAAAAALKAALGRDPEAGGRGVAEIIARYGEAAPALLARAAKGAASRERALYELLTARGDAGCAVSDGMVRAALATPGHGQRSALTQTAAFDLRRIRFAPQLREIAATRADPDWSFAVTSLGKLRDPEALDLLMDQTKGLETPFVVLAALVPLRRIEAALVFEPNLKHPEPRTRVYALWGLAGLGYETALGGLIDLLDDPDQRTETSFAPGQARRAAQALAELHGWPFDWAPEAVAEARRRAAEIYDPAFVATCLADLAAGRIRFNPEATQRFPPPPGADARARES